MEYQEYPNPTIPDTDVSSYILIYSLFYFELTPKAYMYFANLCVVPVLIVLLCSVYVSIDCVTYPPIMMANFDIPTIHTNYNLKEELNLNNCEYIVPGEDNTELLSSSPTDLNVLQLNIRGLLNKQDRLTTLLHEHKVDIALLCETWLKNKTEQIYQTPHLQNLQHQLSGQNWWWSLCPFKQ